MEKEFKRMQFLAGLVKENTIHEEEINLSDLSNLDDIIKQELEKAQKEQPQNEIIGVIGVSTVLFGLALPGIVNGFFKIIKAIIEKAPARFNLKKKNDAKSHLDFIIDFTGQIDSYLDTPFKIVLTPFIKDQTKRNKVANLFKSIVLILAGALTNVDITKSPDIMAKGKELASNVFNFSNFTQEIISNPTTANIVAQTKQIIQQIIK